MCSAPAMSLTKIIVNMTKPRRASMEMTRCVRVSAADKGLPEPSESGAGADVFITLIISDDDRPPESRQLSNSRVPRASTDSGVSDSTRSRGEYLGRFHAFIHLEGSRHVDEPHPPI